MTDGPRNNGNDPSHDAESPENLAIPTRQRAGDLLSLKALLLGQSLSFANASAEAAQSSIFMSCGVSVPILSSGLMYLVLSIHWFWLPSRSDNYSKFENKDTTANGQKRRKETVFSRDDNRGLVVSTGTTTTTAAVRYESVAISSSALHEPSNAGSTESVLELEGMEPSSPSLGRGGDGDEEGNTEKLSPSQTAARTEQPRRRRLAWWIYFVIALLDVEANYIFFLAFGYTSLTSASLLQSLSVVSAMFCAKLFLHRQFTWKHYGGVILCVLGGAVMVQSDVARGSSGAADDENAAGNDADDDDPVRYPYAFWGDLLAFCGAALFGMNDTITEFVVKGVSRLDFLAMLGIYGALISAVQVFLVERKELLTLMSGINAPVWQVSLQLLWYTAAQAYYYMGASWFLSLFDATLLNLSLQSVEVWAALFSIVAQRILPPPAFAAAVVLVVTGVLIYETTTNAVANTAVRSIVPSPSTGRRDTQCFAMVDVNGEDEMPPVPTNREQHQSNVPPGADTAALWSKGLSLPSATKIVSLENSTQQTRHRRTIV